MTAYYKGLKALFLASSSIDEHLRMALNQMVVTLELQEKKIQELERRVAYHHEERP
jgi:hypothetical protein